MVEMEVGVVRREKRSLPTSLMHSKDTNYARRRRRNKDVLRSSVNKYFMFAARPLRLRQIRPACQLCVMLAEVDVMVACYPATLGTLIAHVRRALLLAL